MKKNFKKNSIIVILISIIFLYIILRKNFNTTIKLLFSSNPYLLLLAVALIFAPMVIESISLYLIVKQYDKNYTYRKVLKLDVMTKFFNGITPFGTGGQPLQVYELTRDGIEPINGTNIIVEHFILFQTAVIILSIIAIISNQVFHLFKYVSFLQELVTIGFILNILLLLFAYFISFNEKFNKKAINGIIKFLFKIKLIKNREKTMTKWENYCHEYYICSKELSKNKKLVIECTLLEMLQLSVMFLIPLAIFKSMGIENELNIYTTIIAGVYIFITGSYIPIPGGTGGMEFGFIGFFSNFVYSDLLPPALIVWRFITYYLPMIVGGVVFNIRNIRLSNQKEKILKSN